MCVCCVLQTENTSSTSGSENRSRESRGERLTHKLCCAAVTCDNLSLCVWFSVCLCVCSRFRVLATQGFTCLLESVLFHSVSSPQSLIPTIIFTEQVSPRVPVISVYYRRAGRVCFGRSRSARSNGVMSLGLEFVYADLNFIFKFMQDKFCGMSFRLYSLFLESLKI